MNEPGKSGCNCLDWFLWMRAASASLNRRAEVEQELFDCTNGSRPLPDAAQCRAWAHRLGNPARIHDTKMTPRNPYKEAYRTLVYLGPESRGQVHQSPANIGENWVNPW